MLLGYFLFAGSIWAYGGGGGTKTACKKPEFSAMKPVHLAEVAPRTTIFFKASARTDPASLSITAKKVPVKVSITKNNNSYSVAGKLPASLRATFARIVIKAKSPSGCRGKASWLVKITE